MIHIDIVPATIGLLMSDEMRGTMWLISWVSIIAGGIWLSLSGPTQFPVFLVIVGLAGRVMSIYGFHRK